MDIIIILAKSAKIDQRGSSNWFSSIITSSDVTDLRFTLGAVFGSSTTSAPAFSQSLMLKGPIWMTISFEDSSSDRFFLLLQSKFSKKLIVLKKC